MLLCILLFFVMNKLNYQYFIVAVWLQLFAD